ncbi:MAG: hypothetical protein KAW14_03170, partial [Candidatus Aegiribacteria sp.]|nr:hypothetical protein [Candidatus Aegiribacteria sp.]
MKPLHAEKRNSISRRWISVIPLLVLFALAPAFAIIEESETHSLSIAISELRIPVSPAFQLLHRSPAVITRPQTPRAVLVSMTDAIQNLGDASIAMEFSPYWIFSHPGIDFEDYYNPSPENSLLMNSSISIGFDNLSDSLGTKMAVGFRTVVFPGSPGTSVIRVRTQYSRIVLTPLILRMCWYDIKDHLEENGVDRLLRAAEYHLEEIRQNHELHSYLTGQDLINAIDEADSLIRNFVEEAYSDSTALVDAVYRTALEMADAHTEMRLQELSTEVQEADLSRNGFMLETAGALASRFQDNRFGNHEFTSYAVWVTPGYASNSLEFLGVFRVIRELDLDQTYLDYGIRAGVSSRFFTLSAEGLLRSGDNDSYRIAANA